MSEEQEAQAFTVTEAERLLLEAAVRHSPELFGGTGMQAWAGARPIVDPKLIEARDAVRRERMTPGLLEEAKQAWTVAHVAKERADKLVATLEENGVKVGGPQGLIALEWYEAAKENRS